MEDGRTAEAYCSSAFLRMDEARSAPAHLVRRYHGLPTFMTMPSVKVGFMVHPMSEDLEEYIDPPENPERSNSGFFRGMNENQATQMFIFWSNRIKGWALDQISRVPGCTPEALQRTQVALQFLSSGDRQSAEYADFTTWCKQRSIEPMVAS